MRYICFYGGNGYSGCDYHEYEIFDDGITDDELTEISNELAMTNAESYEHIAAGGWFDDFETEEDREEYYADIWEYCGWTELTAEEFDEERGIYD